MKNKKLLSSILLMLVMVLILGVSNVYADDGFGSIEDLTDTLDNSSSTDDKDDADIEDKNTTTDTNILDETENETANNSSTYNSTNLPETGMNSTIPVIALIVAFGISTVVAYNKVKEYRNI